MTNYFIDCSKIIIIILGWYNRPNNMAVVPSELSLTPPQETKEIF
jgi:hypothetical protein